MARKSGTLLKVAAMLGLAVAAKQLSKKENRDAVVNEYNKVKEDPKGYAQDVQNKFNEQTATNQEKEKQEFENMKDDAKGNAQNMKKRKNTNNIRKHINKKQIRNLRKESMTLKVMHRMCRKKRKAKSKGPNRIPKPMPRKHSRKQNQK